MMRLANKVALLIGAGSGIGEATAHLFAREGACVVVTDLRLDAAHRVAQAIEQAGGQAVGLAVDVRRSADIQAAVQQACATFGALHILHANAGIASTGKAHELSEDEWANVVAINLTGAFLCAKYSLPAIMQAGGGSIIFTASSASIIADRETPAYCATKGALILLTRQMAVDYAREGVRVNCICPGWIATPFNDPFIAANPHEHALTIDRTVPMGRQGNVDEVAHAVLFLATRESAYITGHALVIDGGLTVW
ncbi:MAG: SDR family oxidoreductase [Chloroflexales bacterium]|nr:SDR family oxidoreductase [Chloroflexales bacterium]